jgi:hypothetical protein
MRNLSIAASDTATVIDAIARLLWPALVFLALLLLRRPLAAVLEKIKTAKLSAGGSSLEISTDVGSAVAIVGASLGDPETNHAGAIVTDDKTAEGDPILSQLALTDPAGAIMQAWPQVRSAIKALARRAGLDPSTMHGSPERLKVLISQGLLDQNLYDGTTRLRSVYYRVKQDRSARMSPADAAAYVSAVQSLRRSLNAVDPREVGSTPRLPSGGTNTLTT